MKSVLQVCIAWVRDGVRLSVVVRVNALTLDLAVARAISANVGLVRATLTAQRALFVPMTDVWWKPGDNAAPRYMTRTQRMV